SRRVESSPRLPGLVARVRCRLIVGTDLLADVASVHMSAHRRTKTLGDRRPQLDGRVRQASIRIEHARLDQGPGRARVDASRAAAALLESLRVGFELQGGNDLAEKQDRKS